MKLPTHLRPSLLTRLVTFYSMGALALMLSAIFPSAIFAQDAGTELILNGDMELPGDWEGVNVGGPTKPRVVEVVGDEKHGGENSLHVVSERENPTDFPQVTSRLFPTETGTRYKISFWYKIPQGRFAANMRNGADNDYVQLTSKPLTETDGWELFEAEYEEKAGGESARFAIGGVGDGVCEIYLDDVSVQPIR